MCSQKNVVSTAALCAASSLVMFGLLESQSAQAAIITFNDVRPGTSPYQFDSDGDGRNDIIFSTQDPGGFNNRGPGFQMSLIQEPGLEGTSLLSTDLRIDFLSGARDYLQFGFALSTSQESSETLAKMEVYDSSHTLLASVTKLAKFTNLVGLGRSAFPEGLLKATFQGNASYAKLDFNSDSSRYIIDNFEGNFDGTEIPEPMTALALLGIGIFGMGLRRRNEETA